MTYSANLLRSCAIFGILTALSGSLPAQQPGEPDPFAAGATADPFGPSGDAASSADTMDNEASAASATNGSDATASLSDEDPDPMVRLLRANPPKSPAEYAETLHWLHRIGRWDEIRRYISLIQKANWNQNQLVEFSLAGEADLWFKLRDTSTSSDGAAVVNTLDDSQRQFIRTVSGLPAKLARDPQWLDGWILRLAAKAPADRREAQLRIMRGGRAAIERLCSHLLVGHPRVHGALLVDAILEFRADGVEALRAACMSPDSTARSRVFLGIAQTPASDFGAEMGAAMQDESLPPATSAAIREALLKKYGQLPTGAAVRDYISAKFKTHLDQYQFLRARPARVPGIVWRVADDGKSVKAVEAPVRDHALEALAQLATHRLSCEGTTSLDLIDCATALAQRTYQANQAVTGWLAQPKDAAFWKRVLDQSNEWQMHGAALLAAQAVGQQLDASAPDSESFSVITECLRDSRPAMRYIAVEALAKADVRQPYSRSALMLETAVEMGRLGAGPLVLVVGLSPELRAAAKQQLLALESEAIEATSTAEALEVLNQPYPIEAILMVDRLPRNSILTAVDRLRHSKRGGSLPIAILTDDLDAMERRELSTVPGVVFSVLSELPDQMPRTMNELERRLDTRPLSGEQRQAYASLANQFLTKIAGDRQTYEFYEIVRWEKELAEVATHLPPQTRLTFLGGMGTLASQQELVSLAANTDVSAETREQAAQSFQRSLAQYGLLLSRSAVLQTYDAYNSQGPTDAVTVSALGKILDAIESETKDK